MPVLSLKMFLRKRRLPTVGVCASRDGRKTRRRCSCPGFSEFPEASWWHCHIIQSRRSKISRQETLMVRTAAPIQPDLPETQINAFIAKFDATMAKQIRSCRAALRKLFPTAFELVYDNYNFFVIGYSATERPSDCIVSLAANAKGVGLSFYYGSTLPDPNKILLGGGNQNRFIRLESAATLAKPEVAALLRAAVVQAKHPLPAKGRGAVIIRSISAKQRPRRIVEPRVSHA